ncbi:elongation factor G [Crocosphaera sp. Alani8]|uniref:elongation factor G n=1 Tax=Crocosphaera sp. Alani8 TaxID=3038952 RepID=UPI00313EBCA0
MNLTLPKWLQLTLYTSKQSQGTDEDSINNKTVQAFDSNEKGSSSTTTSLSCLDNYIHQYF